MARIFCLETLMAGFTLTATLIVSLPWSNGIKDKASADPNAGNVMLSKWAQKDDVEVPINSATDDTMRSSSLYQPETLSEGTAEETAHKTDQEDVLISTRDNRVATDTVLLNATSKVQDDTTGQGAVSISTPVAHTTLNTAIPYAASLTNSTFAQEHGRMSNESTRRKNWHPVFLYKRNRIVGYVALGVIFALTLIIMIAIIAAHLWTQRTHKYRVLNNHNNNNANGRGKKKRTSGPNMGGGGHFWSSRRAPSSQFQMLSLQDFTSPHSGASRGQEDDPEEPIISESRGVTEELPTVHNGSLSHPIIDATEAEPSENPSPSDSEVKESSFQCKSMTFPTAVSPKNACGDYGKGLARDGGPTTCVV